MDIKIDNPIRVGMSLIEFDDRIPSIKFSVELCVEKFEFSFSVNMTCWIECAVLDTFVDMLKRGRIARIQDMNNDFSLVFDCENNKLVWSCVKRDVSGNVINTGGEEALADGAMATVLQEFENYPKWW
ncbi:hypothetical protein YA0783_27430 [Pseudomonas corrugata]|uniref:hypothetical protein n=1 Tax=Pseudomonas corrugata TaxID=47879 RepID=UPI0018E662AB|nr:hypothetical protein [Pseudomonas corrugata]MBI6622018.1 hypothetical protein [Pseudomonas corrugata]MBI6695806.1 hypothetical protein [Pseudomonas corrugata]